MEIVFTIVGKVAEQITQSLMTLVCNQIGYVVHCQENIRSLEEELEKLGDLRQRVEGRVERARNNGEIVEDDVWKWLTRAHGLKQEVDEFLECKATRENNNKRWCTPGVCSKYRLGKEAKKKTESVLGLKEQVGNFTEVSHPSVPQPPDFESTSQIDYEHFESRAVVFDEIMEVLKDDEITMIGVYGMGGVGKTRMMEEVGKQAKKNLIFDEVVIAVISQSLNVKRVQGELADRLGLTLDAETEVGRAAQLCKRFKNGNKKTLVIIDDVWNEINLKQIGIPVGVTGSKIVLTSRSQGVCIQMKVQKDFAVGVLLKDEAWTLFMTKVGGNNSMISSPEMRSIAEDVCRECGCLPVALLAVGAALMKYTNKHVWDDALEQLKNSRLNNIEGLEATVYSSLELSYNFLEPAEAKSCFLLCRLFPEDALISVEDLVVYGMGMRLFRDVETVEKARNRVQMLVDNLKTSCLLLGGGDEKLVKMHDVVRDVAISIASKNEQASLVRSDIQEWPEMDTYECYTAIALWSMDIYELPNDLKCPNLRVLLLECINTEVPPSFCSGMENLEVFVLGNMSILTPQSSFSYLVNLRVLRLNYCNLVDVSFLKELKNLEILSLGCSYIKEFGPEISELTRLRLLDLRTCNELGIIPAHVIARLSRLEELYISKMYDDPKVELEATDKDRRNTSLSAPFPLNTLFKKLTRFEVYMGKWNGESETVTNYTFPRTLYILEIPVEQWVQVLFEKAEALYLRRIQGLKKVFHDRDREGFLDLKSLHIAECHDIEYILGDQKWVCFNKLRKLDILECGLKHLVSPSIARGLVQLEHLEIRFCQSMDRIIGNEEDDNDKEAVGLVTFRQLRFLEFWSLPSLISFYPKMKYMSTPEQNQSIPIPPLFNEKVAIPALEKLTIGWLNMKDIWDKKLPEDSFCQLKFIRVEGCHNLVSLIPFNMIQRLQNLEELRIQGCHQISCEFEWLKDGGNETANIELPSLKEIKLWGLPNLIKTGLNHGILAYTNLRNLSIYRCESLTNVLSASTVRSLVHLKEFSVTSCEKIEVIVTMGEEGAGEMNKIVFHQLEILNLDNLPTLRCFCSTVFEEMVVVPGKIAPPRTLFSDEVAFPCLENLSIEDLSNLTKIWQSTLPADSFCTLRQLRITRWDKLVEDVDPSILCARFLTLQECHVEEPSQNGCPVS